MPTERKRPSNSPTEPKNQAWGSPVKETTTQKRKEKKKRGGSQQAESTTGDQEKKLMEEENLGRRKINLEEYR